MSSNVGLSTPRGSGTSGYVQRNTSLLRQIPAHLRASGTSASTTSPHARPFHNQSSLGGNNNDEKPFRARQPDPDILAHERKRQIEIKVLELRDKLEEEGVLDEDEVDARADALRAKLRDATANTESAGGRGAAATADGQKRERQSFKPHQVHELAAAKLEESDRFRRALGIADETRRPQLSTGAADKDEWREVDRSDGAADPRGKPRERDRSHRDKHARRSRSPRRSQSRDRSSGRRRRRQRSVSASRSPPPQRSQRRRREARSVSSSASDSSRSASRSRSPAPRRRQRQQDADEGRGRVARKSASESESESDSESGSERGGGRR